MSRCPSCGNEVVAGTRWCGLCWSYVLRPDVGKLASPGKRFWAHILDLVVPGVAVVVILGVGGAAAGAVGRGEVAFWVVALLFFAYVGYAIWLFARGTTPGKNLLGMYVAKENGERAGFLTMLFREWIGKSVSGLLFGLGYLWILLDRDRQAWHDKLAGTYVVERQP